MMKKSTFSKSKSNFSDAFKKRYKLKLIVIPDNLVIQFKMFHLFGICQINQQYNQFPAKQNTERENSHVTIKKSPSKTNFKGDLILAFKSYHFPANIL